MRISFVLLDLLFFFFGLMRLVRSDAPLLRKARIPVSAVSSMPRRGEQPPIRATKLLFSGSWRLVVRCQSQSRRSSAAGEGRHALGYPIPPGLRQQGLFCGGLTTDD